MTINPATDLPMWVVYERPRDFPAHFVVRMHVVGPGGRTRFGEARLATTLADARKLVPPGRTRLPRVPADDPVIVETWL